MDESMPDFNFIDSQSSDTKNSKSEKHKNYSFEKDFEFINYNHWFNYNDSSFYKTKIEQENFSNYNFSFRSSLDFQYYFSDNHVNSDLLKLYGDFLFSRVADVNGNDEDYYDDNDVLEFYLQYYSNISDGRMLLSIGIKELTTGPGISFHPTLFSPIKNWQYRYKNFIHEIENPFSVSAEYYLTGNSNISAFYFPKYDFFDVDQNEAFKVNLRSFWFNNLNLDLSFYNEKREYSSFGLGLDWIGDVRQVYAEVAIDDFYKYDNATQNRLELKSEFSMSSVLGFHRDIAWNDQGYRFTIEHIYIDKGLLKSRNRDLNLLLDQSTNTSIYLDFLQNIDVLNLYKHKLFLRMASLNHSVFNWGVNAFFFYPLDGMLVNVDISYVILENFVFDFQVSHLEIFDQQGVLSHHPLSHEFKSQLKFLF